MNSLPFNAGAAVPTVDELAEEFLHQRRTGQHSDIDSYAAKYPALADDIREVFPALLAMESLKQDWETADHNSGTTSTVPLQQLGDYRLLREIGRGGMGIVYEAVQKSLDRHVALKLLPQHAVADAGHVRRLQREAKTAAALHHSNIVSVFGFGQEQGYHYIVMQLIDGAPLDRVIRTLREPGGVSLTQSLGSSSDTAFVEGALGVLIDGAQVAPKTEPVGSILGGLVSQTDSLLHTASLGEDVGACEKADKTPAANDSPVKLPDAQPKNAGYWRLVARLGSQIADALNHAHERGTLHRDIKPANILLDAEGAIWVTDFGLAHATDGSNATQSGQLAGTLSYMAPEQFDGFSDERSDVYSLGLTLYELATLRPANPPGSRAETIARATTASPVMPRTVNPNIPADLQTIILKAISRDPVHRYASAGALAEDLLNFEEDRPINARRVSATERFRRWCRRNPWLALSTSACVLLLLLSTIAAAMGYAHEARQRQKMQSMLGIAVDSLESVYDRFIPDEVSVSLAPGSGGRSQDSEVSGKAVLSSEAAAMLEELLPAFDELAQQFSQDDRLKVNAAHANHRVADIHAQLGDVDRALSAYREAIRRYSSLPEADNCLLQIAEAYNGIGKTLQQHQHREGATRAHLDAIAVLLTDAPNSDGQPDTSSLQPGIRFALARTWYLLGHHARGDQTSGKVEPGGLRIHNRNAPDVHGRPSGWESGDGRSKNLAQNTELPDKDAAIGESAEQAAQRHEWLQLATVELQSLKDDFEAPEYSYLLALCLRDLYPKRESAEHERAIELLLELTEAHPDVGRYRYELSRTYSVIRLRPKQEKQRELALKRLRCSIRQFTILVKKHPDVSAYAISAAHTNHRMALQLKRVIPLVPEFEKELLITEAELYAVAAVELQLKAVRSDNMGQSEVLWLARFGEFAADLLFKGRKPRAGMTVLHDIERELITRCSGELTDEYRDSYNQLLHRIRNSMKQARPGSNR